MTRTHSCCRRSSILVIALRATLPLFAAALGLLLVSGAQAAGQVGDGTLESCTESAFDTALAGGGTVTFNCGSNAAVIPITAIKNISADTTIDGGGLITLDAHAVGVFSVDSGVAFTVINLTIANGDNTNTNGGAIYNNGGTVNVSGVIFRNNGAYDGGGIYNESGGTLAVTGSTFSGNQISLFHGGAIYNAGTLTVTNSTFEDHYTLSAGGAVHNTGLAYIANSTFFNNQSSRGAAIANLSGGTLILTNSTFSSNTAANFGGGIYSASPLTITNSTFDRNGANIGGSLYITGTTAALRNTIVANSFSGSNCSGTITDGGYNLDSGTSCGFNPVLGSLNNTNPKLSPLGNYGGPTLTIGPLIGSPAVDAVVGNVNCPNTDQRGVTRPVGTWCDIGAFEGALDLKFLFLPAIFKDAP